MAKKFYYDSSDLLNATVTAGTYSSGNFTASGIEVTNEHYLIDHSLSQAVTSFDD